tara:strand:- start:4195 stop:4938 length:744 start_codon:yes stop_codon:yes gene_type:complete
MLNIHNKKLVLIKPVMVIFDTDNTLYAYEFANKAAEEAACKKAFNLIGIDRSTFFSFYRKARSEIKLTLGKTASGHSRLLYFQRMIELLGLRAELLLALDLEQTFWRTFLANAPLFENVKNTLMLLRENNIPIGVVTDLTSHVQMRKLTYFGLEDMFDAVVTSEEVGADKPDPRNFELLLYKLKINNMKNVWMVGDDPVADIEGAKKLGAIAFQKVTNDINFSEYDIKPDVSFNSFFDLMKLINKII